MFCGGLIGVYAFQCCHTGAACVKLSSVVCLLLDNAHCIHCALSVEKLAMNGW